MASLQPARGGQRLRPGRPGWCAALLAALVLGAAVPGGVAGAHPTSDASHPTTASPVAPPAATNGRLPRTALRPVAGVLLAPEAAASFEAMLAAAARDGVRLAVTDGYRTYDQQVDLKQRKGWLAARPGTSQHGWGVAVDFDTRVTDFAWLREHAGTYGWIHPVWAQPGGSKPEPWHWEFVGGGAHAGPRGGREAGPRAVQAPPAPDELLATARFEPVHGRAGAWFEIREGLAGVSHGPRRYAGTALPGDRGNFAVAGYHRTHGAPLRGVERLWAGDAIRVRLPGGEDLLYRIVDRADLTDDDGWAVGPDPLQVGLSHVMTVTTARADGGLQVVWARLS